jgi:hypothetical protein
MDVIPEVLQHFDKADVENNRINLYLEVGLYYGIELLSTLMLTQMKQINHQGIGIIPSSYMRILTGLIWYEWLRSKVKICQVPRESRYENTFNCNKNIFIGFVLHCMHVRYQTIVD